MSLAVDLEQSKWTEFAGLDVPWMLRQWVERTPDKAALVWCPFEGSEQTWSYAQLQDDVSRLAQGLHERGVKPGDFVILHMDNSPEFILAWYACAMVGAVAVSTNTRSVQRDMSYFAEVTEPVCALTQPKFAELIKASCPNLKFLAVTSTDAGNSNPEATSIMTSVSAVPFSEVFAESHFTPRAADPKAFLSVQFTSGTTSRPKAVVWSHANGLWAGKMSAQHMRLVGEDVTIIYMPLFHTNAQGYSMLATHWSGGTIVVQPRFSASRFWQVCLDHEVTWASMIPFGWKALFNQTVPEHKMRFWGLPATIPEIGEHFNVATIAWWGMTETLTQGIITDPLHPGPRGTIGRAAPEYDIQVRDDAGNPVAPGNSGHLYIRGVRGVSMFQEYYRNTEANQSAFDEDGWFDTGDLIKIDEQGWLYFSDRDKDMLKVGAENVAASEIESVIMQSGLADECAVVAQKHEMLDEVPVVFLIPNKAGMAMTHDAISNAIIAHCEENLPDFKVVRSVHVVEELPRSTLNKIAKNELRQRLPLITTSQ
jgi:crotonobetaine/carnitine-CoA ligase